MRLVGSASLLLLCSCSLLFVDRPSAPPHVYASCTTENVWPLIDIGLGVLSVIGGLEGYRNPPMDIDGNTQSPTGQLAAGVVMGALFGVSSFIGFDRTTACRKHHEEYRRVYGDPSMRPPPGYAPPPPGYGPPPVQPQPQPQGPMPAAEGFSCDPVAGCQPGLVCASNICVRLPPPGPQ